MFNGFFQNQFNNIGQNNLFNNLFEQMGNGYVFPEDNQPQQRRDNKPPPASKRAINNLPVVQITADDLIEETNKECLICLESHVIGMMSSKLPCGHLFHKPCLAEWLVKQCTCPVCRYELETEDAQFEASRKQRMKDRKLRFRKDELKNHSIHQLKELCGKLSISTADCLDKQEIVEKIIRSGKVIVTDGIPPIEMTEEDFHAKNVSELKHLLLAFGLSSEGALEKSDLRNRLLESGRIVLITATSSSSNGKMEIDEGSKSTPSKSTDNAAQVKGGLKGGFGDFENYISYSREELRNMSLSGLRELCKRYQIDITTCLDKSEVIENMIRARNFPVKPDSTIESNSYKEPDLVFQQTSSSSQPPTRSRANSQHGASPSSFIRSRSSSRDPSFSNSRKRSLSNGSSNSYNEPTVIMPPYAHTINAQEPNYSPRSNSSDYYNTEPLDQAINYIGHFLQSTATDLSSQFQAMYQQSTRSRSSSNAPSTPPIAISRASNSTTSTPPQPPRISPNGNGEEHRERLVLSRELLESFSILEIKMILDSYGINSQNCVDKFDHIHALEHSTFVEIVD